MGNGTKSKISDSDHHFAPPPPLNNTDYRHARWPSGSAGRRVPSDEFTSELTGSWASPNSDTSQVLGLRPIQATHNSTSPPLILVVGVCSSGKSTLVRKLNEKGYRARACAQEHSGVPSLWARSNPDVLVYLDASLHTIRQRRRAKWQQEVLDEQHQRLREARERCNLYIHTDGLAPEDVVSRVVNFLHGQKAMDDGR